MPPTKRRREALLSAAPALAAFALIAPALLRGQGLLATAALWRVPPWSAILPPGGGSGLLSDQMLAFLPWREFLRQELSAGRFPLWDPFLLGGAPFLGCVQAAPLFPANLLLALLPAVPFSLAAAFLKLLAAGHFTRLHARRLGATPEGAALAGAVFALGGFMTAWLGHPHANAACVLPALFWALGRLADAPSPRRAVPLSLACACLLLSGHPPTMLHAAAAAAAYALFLSRRPRFLLLAALAAAAGACLAAPAMLPYLEYLRESSTAAASGGLGRWAFKLSPWELLHLVMPLASGSPARGAEVLSAAFGLGPMDNFLERAAWTGLLPLLLAARALVRRDRERLFHAGLALFGLAAALGVPPLPQLWKALPGFSSVNPMRLTLLWSFGVATLAGLGLGDADDSASRRRLLRGGAAVACAAALAYALALAGVWGGLEGSERAFAGLVLLLFAVEAAAAWAVLARPAARAWAVPAAALFALIPAWGVNTAAPASTFYPATPEAQALKAAAGEGRAFGLGWSFEPDTGLPSRLRDARGRDFTTPRRYEELVTGTSGDFDFWTGARELPPNPRLLGIGAIAATPRLAGAVPKGWVKTHDGPVGVWRSPEPARRALFVSEARAGSDAETLAAVRTPGFDPGKVVWLDRDAGKTAPAKGAARIVDDGVNAVTVEVDADGSGWLVLLDGWMPGWEASVSGAPSTPVLRADHAFRAVAVPGGKSTVMFRYRPASLRLGLALFGLAACVLAAVLILA